MANPTFGYPGAYSGFIPSFEASGMLIDYTRDPKTFKLNDYCQYVDSKKPIGIYAVLDADQPARVVTDDDFSVADGAEFPAGNDNLLPFVFLDYRCVRKSYPFTLGDETVDNADWKVLAAHAGMAAQQCMTGRTWQAYLALNGQLQNGQPAAGAAVNPAAVFGSNASAVQALVPGISGWYAASDDESSPNYLAIKKTLMTAWRQINVQTSGKVQQADLRLCLGPDDALAISETSEVHDYIRNTPYALDQIKGNKDGQNTLWGLPDFLYGFKVIVEDCVRVSNRPNLAATTGTGLALAMGQGARNYVWAAGTAFILSRPGGLQGTYGAPSYSTLQQYFYREMEVQSHDDRLNERTMGRVVESRATKIAAAAAGYALTSINH